MRLKITALAALTAVIFSSCDKDLSEEYGQLPDTAGLSSNTSGLSNASTCKDCIYYPVCSGSVYHYSDTTAGSTSGTQNNYTLQYVKDTLISGKIYQKMTGAGQQNTYFNCTSGVSTSIVLGGTTQGGATIPYAKITALKANEPVAATWADIISNGSGQDATYTYTIISKGTARTVAGNSYPDVIHVHEQTTIDVPGIGIIPAGQSEYYFARGKGLIESVSIDDFSGTQILHHVLISATIP